MRSRATPRFWAAYRELPPEIRSLAQKAFTGADPDHSIGEHCWITFGLSTRGRLLAVAHTDEGDIIRIIARAATRPERRLYEEG